MVQDEVPHATTPGSHAAPPVGAWQDDVAAPPSVATVASEDAPSPPPASGATLTSEVLPSSPPLASSLLEPPLLPELEPLSSPPLEEPKPPPLLPPPFVEPASVCGEAEAPLHATTTRERTSDVALADAARCECESLNSLLSDDGDAARVCPRVRELGQDVEARERDADL